MLSYYFPQRPVGDYNPLPSSVRSPEEASTEGRPHLCLPVPSLCCLLREGLGNSTSRLHKANENQTQEHKIATRVI